MPVRLIALDIDGTLLNSRMEVSAVNREAIAEATRRGMEVALVTGRRYDFAMPVRQQIEAPITMIVNNGALVRTHDGQTHLGIAIFELGERRQSGEARPVELVFDPRGAARVRHLTPEEEDRQYYFWVNEHSPTFLQADPPALRGEPRFEVEFGIDANKRLLITARDLKTKRLMYRNHPVVKLS